MCLDENLCSPDLIGLLLLFASDLLLGLLTKRLKSLTHMQALWLDLLRSQDVSSHAGGLLKNFVDCPYQTSKHM